MYIEVIRNRNSPPAILLRESYREDGKVKKRTLANLSHIPMPVIESLRAALRGESVTRDQAVIDPEKTLRMDQGRQHGAAAAVIAVIRKLGLDRIINRQDSRKRRIVLAMIADRLLSGDSKLATARHCHSDTASTTLGPLLDLEDLDEQDCYQAMDWLLERKERIEKLLAAKHFTQGSPILFDLSSSYFEGHTCPLAQYGYSRDHRSDLPQINYGLYCAEDGTPLAVDILPGNEGDRVAFPKAVERTRNEFGGDRVIFVGDRGMIGGKVIDEILRGMDGADWITALASPTIRRLERDQAIQTTLFDDYNLGSITHPDFPDERLIVCRNPALAKERERKRNELLDATEKLLQNIQKRLAKPKTKLNGQDAIGIEVGKVINRKKVGKHFDTDITDSSFTYQRNTERITAEAALDGIYVIRTSIKDDDMSDAETVAHYKNLARVERAFRSLKSSDVQVRPIHHRRSDRVRAHVFICMLAYYVEKAMRAALEPILFHDEHKAPRTEDDVVKPAQRSKEAQAKDASRETADGYPISSFRDVLNTLGGIIRSRVRFEGYRGKPISTTSAPSRYQKHILALLGVPGAL